MLNKGHFTNFAQIRFLKESKKDVRIEKIHAKIMKIGLVDPEIALLVLTSDEDGRTPYNSPRWSRPDAADNSVTPRAPIFIPGRRGQYLN